MRQQRTNTAESLAGIWEISDWEGVNVFRPLLGQSRADLRAYLVSLGQPWIDDPSNSDRRFERVRVRQTLAQEAGRTCKKSNWRTLQKSRTGGPGFGAGHRQWIDGQLTSYPEGFGAIPRTGFCELESRLAAAGVAATASDLWLGPASRTRRTRLSGKWIMGRGFHGGPLRSIACLPPVKCSCGAGMGADFT